MKFCPQCNAQLTDDAKFCTTCGAPTANVPPAYAEPVQYNDEPAQYSEPMQYSEPANYAEPALIRMHSPRWTR